MVSIERAQAGAFERNEQTMNTNPNTFAETKNELLTGAILPALMRFAIPILLSLILQTLYGAVDLWAVGVFGTPADVAAVAIGSQTMQIITGVLTGLSTGTTVMLGRKVGAGDARGAAWVVGASAWLFGAAGIALSVLMVSAAPLIAAVMDTPPEALSQTVIYIRICGAGSVLVAVYNFAAAVFRGIGDSKSPLLFVSVACVANIALDILLIAGFGMGPAGAAIATVVAQGGSVALTLVLFRRHGLGFPLSLHFLRLRLRFVKNTLRIGSPVALQDLCNETAYLVIIGLVNALGVIVSAGVGIAERLSLFIFLIPMSYIQAISAFVAQNAGAGLMARARRAVLIGMTTAFVPGILLATALVFCGDIFTRIFTDEPSVIAASSEFLRATALESLVLSLACCLSGYFNGIGRTTFVMVCGLCSVLLVRLPVAWYASTRPNPSLYHIGLSTVLAALFTLLANLAYALVLHRKESRKSAASAKAVDRLV